MPVEAHRKKKAFLYHMFCELSSFLQYFEDVFQNIHVNFLMNTFLVL